MILPLLKVWRAVREQVLALDRLAYAVAKRDARCRLLLTAPGVGTITALAYVAAVERPEEFKNGRAVSAWVGLTPARYQSGQIDVPGRISRQGDVHLRTYLYEAANTVLTRSRADTALKRWGLGLKARLGHKKAVVAVARKLAVVLHAMWARQSRSRQTPSRPPPERLTSAHPSASRRSCRPCRDDVGITTLRAPRPPRTAMMRQSGIPSRTPSCGWPRARPRKQPRARQSTANSQEEVRS